MKLSFEKIKELVTGAARIEDEDGAVRPYRFTKEQSELYRQTKEGFYLRSLATAGIRLMFETDSTTLYLKLRIETGSSRQYFSADVFADGKPVGYLDNVSGLELPQDYTKESLPLKECEKAFELGAGVKTVCIYLPWSKGTAIEALELDDGSYAKAVKPQKKLLAFGDSITQGYDALRPSNRYAAKLADLLGAEEFNKAIGGEKFFPALAELKDPIDPDYITVAYGSNDWGKENAPEVLVKNCKAFYETISRNYPNAKIFAITPIWRKDHATKNPPFGPFERVAETIRDAVKDLKNVTLIHGFDFVPKDESYYADLRLHPNDKGFAHYAENLYNAIKKELK